MASHTTVFDDLDDDTARTIIDMELEEIRRLSLGAADAGIELNDEHVARQMYEAELKAYKALRGFTEAGDEDTADTEAEGDETQLRDPPPPDCVPHFDCSVCGDSNVSDYDYPAPCGHHYCSDCLTSLFSTSMRDERLYPPRCCSQQMPFEDTRIYLSAEVASEFDRKKEELDDPKRTYCHVPTCSTYVPSSQRDGDVATCPSCQVATCTTCNGATHDGDCPNDQGVQEILEAGRQEGWQRCFSCKRMVELTIGCNHITCLCRAEFCYVCGVQWKTCDCPQWHEERLFARAEQVAHREGGDAARLAGQLRQRHECENGRHRYERAEGEANCDECGGFLRNFIWRCVECHTDVCSRCRFNT